MEIDPIDWLTHRTMSLIWRSEFDSVNVRKRNASEYDVHELRPDEIVLARFIFEKCLATSIEDLFRSRHFRETYQLRHAVPGADLSFLHHDQVFPEIDRSRLRPEELLSSNLNRTRSSKHHAGQHGIQPDPNKRPVDPTPPILSDNGFRMIPYDDNGRQCHQLVHMLGKICLPNTFITSNPLS